MSKSKGGVTWIARLFSGDASPTPEWNPENCHEIVHEVRTKTGLSRTNLGAKIGVSYQSIADWENGVRQPSLDRLQAMCDLIDKRIVVRLEDKDEQLT